ncbi:hypothetical protein MTY414_42140 [Mycolicibacterium mageritense]|nr:hypothetical protein MTY414_42140 [Mycolicibacterium mageritense]
MLAWRRTTLTATLVAALQLHTAPNVEHSLAALPAVFGVLTVLTILGVGYHRARALDTEAHGIGQGAAAAVSCTVAVYALSALLVEANR